MSARRRDPATVTPEGTRSPASVAHSPGNGHRCDTAPPHWTVDPTHPLHIEAKAKRCPICRAEPGQPCRNIAKPPYGDRLHNARTEAP